MCAQKERKKRPSLLMRPCSHMLRFVVGATKCGRQKQLLQDVCLIVSQIQIRARFNFGWPCAHTHGTGCGTRSCAKPCASYHFICYIRTRNQTSVSFIAWAYDVPHIEDNDVNVARLVRSSWCTRRAKTRLAHNRTAMTNNDAQMSRRS